MQAAASAEQTFFAAFEEMLEVVTCAVARLNLTDGIFPWHGSIGIEMMSMQ